jgi:hypothetical protein
MKNPGNIPGGFSEPAAKKKKKKKGALLVELLN